MIAGCKNNYCDLGGTKKTKKDFHTCLDGYMQLIAKVMFIAILEAKMKGNKSWRPVNEKKEIAAIKAKKFLKSNLAKDYMIYLSDYYEFSVNDAEIELKKIIKD